MIQYVFQSSEDDSESSTEDGEETEILQQNGIPSPNKVPRMSNTDMSKDPSSTQVDELKETENIFQVQFTPVAGVFDLSFIIE